MPDSYDRIWVISDLHLPPSPSLGNFLAETGQRLVEWTRQRRRDASPNSALVLAGDIVDFLLLERRPEVLDLRDIRRFVRETLQRLSAESPWINDWRAALKDYGQAGGHVVLMPGNHDPEWLHPYAAEEFARWLGHDGEWDRLTVVRDSDTWEATVGNRQVVVLHGHRYDSQNDIDRSAVLSAIRAGDDSVSLPPGSQLVLGPLHHFKQAIDEITGKHRFPFLDAVKPEVSNVVALLFALDPKLFFQRLPATLALTPRMFLRSLSQMLRDSATGYGGLPVAATMLSRGISDSATEHDEHTRSISDLLAQDFAASLSESDRLAIDATLARLTDYLTQEPAELAHRGAALASNSLGPVRRWFLRWWLQRERTTSQSEKFFSLTHRDSTDDRIIEAHLPPDVTQRVVIAGHTHAAREISLPGERVYLNTGTWTNLLDLGRCGETDADLDRLMDDLTEGRIPSFVRPTWAEVTRTGCSLRTE